MCHDSFGFYLFVSGTIEHRNLIGAGEKLNANVSVDLFNNYPWILLIS